MSVLSIKQLLAWKPPYLGDAFISDGILLPGTRMIVCGPPGSWKSMLAQHTAIQIANGNNWFLFGTRKATVLKVQVELPQFLDQQRLSTYVSKTGNSPDNVFYDTPEDMLKLDQPWGMAILAKSIEEAKHRCPNTPLVVILDPLKDLMGGKITDEQDVQKWQDNCKMLQQKYNFAVIIFHHPRKRQSDDNGFKDSGAEEGVGSYKWNAWCDTWLTTKIVNPYSGSNIIEYRWEKHRNAHKFLPNFKAVWNDSLVPTIIKDDPPEVSLNNLKGEQPQVVSII
jgi:RecA-family ATPase